MKKINVIFLNMLLATLPLIASTDTPITPTETVVSSATPRETGKQIWAKKYAAKKQKWAKKNALRNNSAYKKMTKMTFEELLERKNKHQAEKNYDLMIKYLDQMIAKCPDTHVLKDVILELANVSFEQGQREKAGKHYAEFIDLYPGSPDTEHATHRAILCHFKEISPADRDQAKTRQALKLCEDFLAQPRFTKNKTEVKHIHHACCQRLFEHDAVVFDYYHQSGRLGSAQKRLQSIEKKYEKHHETLPAFKQKTVALSCKLAEATKDKALLEAKTKELMACLSDDTVITGPTMPHDSLVNAVISAPLDKPIKRHELEKEAFSRRLKRFKNRF